MNKQKALKKWVDEMYAEDKERGYSDTYITHVKLFQEYLEDKLKGNPVLTLTQSQYKNGLDSVPTLYREIVNVGVKMFREEKHYELSYNQTNKAFFRACFVLDIIVLTK